MVNGDFVGCTSEQVHSSKEYQIVLSVFNYFRLPLMFTLLCGPCLIM
jgi:hypothetical protein